MEAITTAAYRQLANNLLAAIGRSEYYNGTIDLDTEEINASLTCVLIIYREDRMSPDSLGDDRDITKIVPVWWELRTYTEGIDTTNDFLFTELNKYLA